MPFFRVLMRVSTSDGSPVLADGLDAYAYRKAWCSSEEQARESALRTVGQQRELRILQARQNSRAPLRFEVVRVTSISFWDWLTCSYRGLLMRDQKGSLSL